MFLHTLWFAETQLVSFVACMKSSQKSLLTFDRLSNAALPRSNISFIYPLYVLGLAFGCMFVIPPAFVLCIASL